mmetsp:Transcript_24803/g.46324  ORF Transcript_24803/g.46324 Transcript_24803/m.46324 type:complete len:243 (-) Transcript_24803:32-760(-)
MLENENPFSSSNKTSNRKNKKECSICSLRFYPLPVLHVRANMWTAHCSYIRNLIEPKNYEHAVSTMLERTVNHTILGSTQYGCMQPPKDTQLFLGVGRYAMERWPLNHPHVQPCDAMSKAERLSLKKKKASQRNFTPQLTSAPQKRAKTVGINSMRSPWERLAGRLLEWKQLYGMTPSKSSWVWKWYKGYETGTSEYLEVCEQIEDESIRNLTARNVTVDGKPLWNFLSLAQKERAAMNVTF